MLITSRGCYIIHAGLPMLITLNFYLPLLWLIMASSYFYNLYTIIFIIQQNEIIKINSDP